MSSPRPAGTAAAPSTQPLTPPLDAPASSNPAPQTTQPASSSGPTPAAASPPQFPATSFQDTGKSRRPRDARLIHMLLASMGVTAYQERVPLQLLDFAYRYTANTLQDTVYLVTEGYSGDSTGTGTKGGDGGGGKSGNDINISLNALRMSIASRLQYQFQPGLPKEFLMEVASERNRVLLPGVSRGGFDSTTANNASVENGIVMGGMHLPPERFCLTEVGWGLKDQWESEGEEDMEVDTGPQQNNQTQEKDDQEGAAEDEDVDGTMEDIFGDGDLGENNDDGDEAMTGV